MFSLTWTSLGGHFSINLFSRFSTRMCWASIPSPAHDCNHDVWLLAFLTPKWRAILYLYMMIRQAFIHHFTQNGRLDGKLFHCNVASSDQEITECRNKKTPQMITRIWYMLMYLQVLLHQVMFISLKINCTFQYVKTSGSNVCPLLHPHTSKNLLHSPASSSTRAQSFSSFLKTGLKVGLLWTFDLHPTSTTPHAPLYCNYLCPAFSPT